MLNFSRGAGILPYPFPTQKKMKHQVGCWMLMQTICWIGNWKPKMMAIPKFPGPNQSSQYIGKCKASHNSTWTNPPYSVREKNCNIRCGTTKYWIYIHLAKMQYIDHFVYYINSNVGSNIHTSQYNVNIYLPKLTISSRCTSKSRWFYEIPRVGYVIVPCRVTLDFYMLNICETVKPLFVGVIFSFLEAMPKKKQTSVFLKKLKFPGTSCHPVVQSIPESMDLDLLCERSVQNGCRWVKN